MTDLPRRAGTALIYGIVVLVAVLGPREVFLAALAAMVALGLIELIRLMPAGTAAALELLVLLLGAASLFYLRVLGDTPGTSFSSSLAIGPLFSPLVMTVVAVWAADITAYVVGSTFGRHRIAPRISPGKTWEGTLASFVAAAVIVVLWNRPFQGVPQWAALAAVALGPSAFVGDLLESWVKRRAGVKDSGTLLPGHGGILDRVDSLLAAATLVAALITYLTPLG